MIPSRKRIVKEQGKDWDLVKISTIERTLRHNPKTPFSALNISRAEFKRIVKERRIERRKRHVKDTLAQGVG